ncbi:alternate-type signal peptide domain-containing protein [Aeromicrobium alkaliterrae]|uniref:Alternate-type signal peptide domain-containing protein n=1 Tax=Aeromicrobium alkaliterrae TaxID=302168 RepID=A0ABN2JIL7_9ACTN
MKKSTKGALAAGAAAVILLGGAGTLAYWTADTTIDGGDINSGQLLLSAADCGDEWTLDTGEDAPGAEFIPGTTLIVPGDVITKTCEFDITATGDHLRATLAPSDAEFSSPANALSDDLTIDATYTIGGVAAPAEITEANDGDTVVAVVSVTFDSASTNESQDLAATLDTITITATQVHN